MQLVDQLGLELARDEIGDLVAVVPGPCLEQQPFQRTIPVGVLAPIVPQHPAAVEFPPVRSISGLDLDRQAPIAKFRMLRLECRQPGHFPQAVQHSLRLGVRQDPRRIGAPRIHGDADCRAE